jgi:hypothetical protein
MTSLPAISEHDWKLLLTRLEEMGLVILKQNRTLEQVLVGLPKVSRLG